MEPQLRALLDHAKFYQGAVHDVAALLPPTDDELAALITETCAAADQLGFLLVTTAAVHGRRTLDAALLECCAGLMVEVTRLGCFAWKMTGDVPGALLAALARDRFARPLHAGMLFVIAAWCTKHRGGTLPPGFAAEARALARVGDLPAPVLVLLDAAAVASQDEALLAVLTKHHPNVARAQARAAAVKYGEALVTVFEGPALALVPTEPPREFAHRQPIQRAVEKSGRNDPCPCGSGRKYKRCCFEKDRDRLSFSSEVAGKTVAELRVEPETGLTEGRLKAMIPPELARLDPRKVPSSLRTVYLMQCTGLNLLERSAEAFEVMTFDDDEDFENAWNFVMFFVLRAQRQDIAKRMVAARSGHAFKKEVADRYRLLLARDNPAAELAVLGDLAHRMLVETDPEELGSHAYGLLCSRHTALGILVARSFIANLERKQASFLLKGVLDARDKLGLPPDDPFSDLLEKRLAEETSDEGADAARLREARQRLDAKATEVRALKEEIDQQRRKLDRHEKAPRPASPQPVPRAAEPGDEAALREMRGKLAHLKGTLHERAEERLALRHELERARDDLEALRRGGSTAPTDTTSRYVGEDEVSLYLPEQPAGNQPLRLAEYPPRFLETLEGLPRQAARTALALIGRLAGGEPAAFTGVVQLKACHGVLRQRIGSEHRLLFRLLPDRVQVLDLVNRRDLDRTIKRLRIAG